MTTDWNTLQRYARAAGIAMLLSIVFGALGEMVLPNRIIVSGNAAATAANFLAHPGLVRLSFSTYLVEGICDIALAVFFYVLLRPVNRNLALLSAFFGLASMALYAVAQSSFFAASLAVGDSAGMAAFSAEQRSAVAMLLVRTSYTIASLFLILYGIATMLRGFLIIKSGYLPKVLGVLLSVGGAGFFLRTTTMLLAPSYSSNLMLIPMALGGIPLMLWLLIRGVRSEPRLAPARSRSGSQQS
jgi:hypothetical protein